MSTTSRKTWTAVLALLLVLPLGCTNESSDPGGTASVTGGPTSAGEGNPTPPEIMIDSKNIPPADGYFRIALLTNPPDLDPILVSDTTSDAIASKIFNTLVTYDSELNLVPDLAKSLPQISDDGTVYTFELRRGVKFQNGRELKAADIKYSLERLASTSSKRSNVVKPIRGANAAIERGRTGGRTDIDGIEVVDDYTVRITLEKPYVPFLFLMAMVNSAAVPREVVEAKGDLFSREPVGTGPFRMIQWREHDMLQLDRFEDHFAGTAKIAGIRYRVIPSELPRLEEYKAGNLELCDVVQGTVPKWKKSNHADEVLLWPQTSILYYGFNLEKEGSPYAGYGEKARKLRQAINYAIDRPFICEKIVDGRYDPSNGIIPPGLPGHADDRPRFEQDIAKAKALLAEAGYPNGEGLPVVDLWFNQQGDNGRIATAVQQDLKQVGIGIELKQLDWGAYIEACDAGEPAFFRLGWVADYPDPENYLYFLFHSENKGPNGNVSFYGRPEVDRLIDESYGIVEPMKRLAVLREAEEMIMADWPWLFIASIREGLLVKPYVRNFHPTAMDDDSAGGSHVDWLNVTFDPGYTE